MLTNYTIEPRIRHSLVVPPCLPKSEAHCLLAVCNHKKKNRHALLGHNHRMSTPTRFELARAEPIGFQNQLLNHSDTVSVCCNSCTHAKGTRQRRDLNSRGQSPVDFESTSLTTRTRCLFRHSLAMSTTLTQVQKAIANPSFDLGTFRL